MRRRGYIFRIPWEDAIATRSPSRRADRVGRRAGHQALRFLNERLTDG